MTRKEEIEKQIHILTNELRDIRNIDYSIEQNIS
jgi:hypothetical protein